MMTNNNSPIKFLGYNDRRAQKGLNPWTDETPGAWVGDSDPPPDMKMRLVPAVYAAISARCKAMADLPFSIYRLDGDEAVDSSDEYNNEIGFISDPFYFLWMSEAALVCYGRSFWERLGSTADASTTRDLRYFLPSSIIVKVDKRTGEMTFERHANQTIPYKEDDLLYFWLPDPAVEKGPPEMWPLKSALVAAGALGMINKFVFDFMERGAVKALLLAAKGMPDPVEAEKAEKWFNKLMSGARRMTWKIFNADAFQPTIVGEGLEAFRGIQITDDLKRQIHEAMGTRHMLEDENYATANAREREFYANTIVPDSRIIQSALNTQILNDMGYHLEFEPERLEVFQQDEADSAQALSTVVKAFTDSGVAAETALPLAMSILGYELTPEQQGMLDIGLAAGIAQREANRQQMARQLQPEQPIVKDVRSAMLEIEQWQRKASKNAKAEFVAYNIPGPIVEQLRARLDACKDAGEKKLAFDLAREALIDGPAPIIAALKEAVEEARKNG